MVGTEQTVGHDAVLVLFKEAYEYALDGLQIRRIEHISRHFHRVDVLTCGEGEGVVAHRIAFVVVHDGIGEVDGVGGVGLQCVEEVDAHLLAYGADVGRFGLGRRHDDLLAGVLDLDIFIELDGNLLPVGIGGLIAGCAGDDPWRRLVVGTAVGRADVSTGHGKQHQEEEKR